ncbi:MAG: tetratricopeptide repeat protein [Planctomycetota bacterium]
MNKALLRSRHSGLIPPVMWRSTLGCAALILAVLFSMNPAAVASEYEEGSLTLDRLVSPDTLLYVRCSGVDRFLEEARSLDLMRLWTDPEVDAFFAEMKKMVPQMLGGEAEPDWPVDQFWNLFKGDVAMAMSPRLAVFEEGAMPTPALAVDMAGAKERFVRTVNGIVDMLVQEAGIEKDSFDYRGFEVGFFGEPRKRVTICHTTLRNLFVATLNPHHIKNLIDRYLDGGASLADDPAFVTSRARVGGFASGLLAYANFKPLINMFKPLCPYEVQEALAMEGLDQIDGLCIASTIEGGGSRESVFIHAPGEKKGLLKALSPHPITWKHVSQAPPDTLFFVDIVFDPELILNEVDRFVKHVIPELYKDFRSGLKEVQHETGFDLEREILGPLGSELALFVTLPKGGGMSIIPDVIASISLDDAEGFKAFLEKLHGMTGGEIEVVKSSFDNHTLRHIVIPDVPFSPAFTVTKDRLLLASTPMTMKKYLKWVKKGEPGLDSTAAFKEAVRGVPENASMFKYVDMRRSVEIGYSMAGPFLPALLAEADLPLDVGLLPMTETVSEYINNASSYMVMDQDGIMMSGRCPCGLGALLGLAVSGMDHLVQNNLLGGLMKQAESMAAAQASGSMLDGARGLMGSGHYAEAEKLFTQWEAMNPQNALPVNALLNRGYCRLKLEKYDLGIEDYMEAAERDQGVRQLAYYNIACGYSLMKHADEAVDFLEKSVKAGWQDKQHILDDSDFDNIRENERYKELLKKL